VNRSWSGRPEGGSLAKQVVRAASVLAAVLVLGGLVASVFAASREQALAALAQADDVEARRRGAQWLGEHGSMEDLPALVSALRDRDPLVRALAERAMWEVWSRSSDEETDRLLVLGTEQMSMRQLDMAVETFTRVIERTPAFAEGWNKRATAYFLMGEYAKSLADCDEVMKRNPLHFGALSGYGMIYLQLDQPGRALHYFERALAVNPNLRSVEEAVETLRRWLLERRRDTT
jgi:tetratricopeptide (TPR) repeat protein